MSRNEKHRSIVR